MKINDRANPAKPRKDPPTSSFDASSGVEDEDEDEEGDDAAVGENGAKEEEEKELSLLSLSFSESSSSSLSPYSEMVPTPLFSMTLPLNPLAS